MDGTLDIPACRALLDAVTHRPYSSGFYFGQEKRAHFNDGAYRSDAVFAAEVLSWENGAALVRQRNRFAVGETLEILSPHSFGLSFPVTSIETQDGLARASAPHPMEILRLPCPHPVRYGDLLRRRAPGPTSPAAPV